MLRRPATTITLTTEDVSAYEARRQQQQWAQTSIISDDGAGEENTKGRKKRDPNDELRPLPQEKARVVRSAAERIMGSRS